MIHGGIRMSDFIAVLFCLPDYRPSKALNRLELLLLGRILNLVDSNVGSRLQALTTQSIVNSGFFARLKNV